MIPSSQSLSVLQRRLVACVAACILCLFLYQSWILSPQFLFQSTPSSLPPTIPKTIWYKLGPKGLSENAQNWTNSCIEKNLDYRAEFLTDETADAWVQKSFTSRPDIVESYLSLTVPILKADFLRYLLLYVEGGIWSDLDVSCEDTPIDDWIPAQYKGKTSLVVGWEFDVGWGKNILHQLNSWMILAKPGLPHMLAAIDGILDSLHEVASKNGVAIANVTLPMVGDVVDFTGPRRLTRSVFQTLQQKLNVTDDEFDPIEESTWFIREPKQVADVLILPGYSFASSTNHYDKTDVVGPPLVTHHYAGSWKNDHGGEEV